MDTPTTVFVICIFLASFLLTLLVRREFHDKERLRRDQFGDSLHNPLRTRAQASTAKPDPGPPGNFRPAPRPTPTGLSRAVSVRAPGLSLDQLQQDEQQGV